MSEFEINVLMQDRCTRKEAENLIKKGTLIWGNPLEWVQSLRNNDCYEGQTVDKALNGEYEPDVTPVEYEGHTYLIEYVY